MAARTLLLKLERAGHFRLPRRRANTGHALGLIARRIRADWQGKYRHPIHALETFVDRDRFRGTCHQAANRMRLGSTQGRTRNDRYHCIRTSVKDVYLYPLSPNFRKELCAC
jgi:hypothetical protein